MKKTYKKIVVALTALLTACANNTGKYATFDSSSDQEIERSLANLRSEFESDQFLLDALNFYENGSAYDIRIAYLNQKGIDASSMSNIIPKTSKFREISNLDSSAIKILYINHLSELRRLNEHVIKEDNIENEKLKTENIKKRKIDSIKIEKLVSYPYVLGPCTKIGIKNTGDDSITTIEITVYFLDSNGEEIFEDRIIIPDPYGFNLKPGYSYEMPNCKQTSAILNYWKNGSVRAEVTGVNIFGEN
jgi:hypothetical protein